MSHLSPLVSRLSSQWALDALPACVSHLSPSCLPLHPGCSARMILHPSHLSPSVSHLFPTGLRILCPHDFKCHRLPLVILHWSPTCCPPVSRPWLLYARFHICLRLVSLVSHLSPTRLGSGCPACMILHLSPTCPRLSPACLSRPHDFTFVSGLSRLVIPPPGHLSPTRLWMLCPHDFMFVSHFGKPAHPVGLHTRRPPPLVSHLSSAKFRTCLPLAPLLSATGFSASDMWSIRSRRVCCSFCCHCCRFPRPIFTPMSLTQISLIQNRSICSNHSLNICNVTHTQISLTQLMPLISNISSHTQTTHLIRVTSSLAHAFRVRRCECRVRWRTRRGFAGAGAAAIAAANFLRKMVGNTNFYEKSTQK